MAELLQGRGACAGLELPLEIGSAVCAAGEEAAMISIAPFRGREADVSALLSEHTGLPLPDVGRRVAGDTGWVAWSGAGQWFLRGAAAELRPLDERLAEMAATTEQGDAWAVLRLSGTGAAAVLARLVPIDVGANACPPGTAARTLLGHIPCLLLAEEGEYTFLVMRSFAATAVHDVKRAMQRVAGIDQLPR